MSVADSAFLAMCSAVPGIDWPPLSAGFPASVLALAQQLEQTQWLAPSELAARQRRQLRALLTHAAQHSPHFGDRLRQAGCGVAALCEPGGLAALAPLSRRALQADGARVAATALPSGHGPTGQVSTSGSSGTPVSLTRSAVNQMFWLAFTLREHLWQRRDFSAPLAVTRANLPGNAAVAQPDWGAPVATFFATGPAYALPINRAVTEQLDWLLGINPGYLLTYPTNLAALLDEIERRGGALPRLRQIRTIGETLAPALRARTRAVLGVGIADCYSSQELGVIALQCPDSELYHLMAEGYITEILREDGSPCADGEVGRLVLTDLHNFATPLVRYDIGDYACAGPACPCGRGLPTLRHIVGRERNMVSIGGRRHWPLVGFHRFRDVAPVIQYQLVQRSAEHIDVNLVCATAPSEAQQKQLGDIIRQALGHPFQLGFHLFADRIPMPASGKFEEFVNLTV
ncbi:phenylacetate--CoA ligase family protein [Janthinobacterium fluminis]|uniref:Phenylacetate--CoA ligase family protein n=1 Tax=Janthinobacterium fluminis TaxID=2987524 RepID=A0ABT5JYG9_9BURK|nr:hypothetical protein [Janthinobacterium fluminis]MDC8757198.1 hypothetical protein [Janthinobacterium fluminis]